jgi:hypothetical protein
LEEERKGRRSANCNCKYIIFLTAGTVCGGGEWERERERRSKTGEGGAFIQCKSSDQEEKQFNDECIQ